MEEILKPSTVQQVQEAVAWAAASRQSLEIRGAGSKRGLGCPVQAQRVLELSALSGVVAYEPAELVLTVRAGTPLSEVEALLAERRQHLAFEPADLGPLLGGPARRGTIGGVLACSLAGPRRIQAGAARDHFLGVQAVSGRDQLFKAGGKVVKNVTGFDLCKLLAGSYGTLAVMTEVTLKVLPAPEDVRTLVLEGLRDEQALAAMTAALHSPNEVSGAAHWRDERGGLMTALRLEGFGPSVAARMTALKRLMPAVPMQEQERERSLALWGGIRDVSAFAGRPGSVWRLSVPPASGARVVATVRESLEAEAIYDWGGGLIWLRVDAPDAGHLAIRRAVAPTGGHATLIRAPREIREAVPVFQPQPQALAALTRRVKEGFDPLGILNPGRMNTGP